jgi:UDP-N-acetylglucosamine:LPS N-acetylglucosamine transferase
MKKVIILTAGFGEGHNAAARNLRNALEVVSDEVKVEILDLFETTYGSFNTLAKNAYLGMVQYAPRVWGGIYSLLDNSTFVENRLGSFTKMRNALGDILHETQPDCVVSTYPVYAHVIHELFRATLPVHHRGDGFHHHQLHVVSRAERFVLRAERGHGGGVEGGGRAGGADARAGVSREPFVRRTAGAAIKPAVVRRAAAHPLHHQHRQEKSGQGD